VTAWSASDVAFRPLAVADLPLVYDWLGREHVSRWWGARGAYDEAVAEYLDAIEGRDPTDLFVIVSGGEDVGLIQTYLLADYPAYAALVAADDEAAGLDIFLGDTGLTGAGLGTHVIRRFAREIVFARAETRACLADPDVRNGASIRAFEKAGFTAVSTFFDPEDAQLHTVMRLDRPHESEGRSTDGPSHRPTIGFTP
jgi:aminoglycoside 6'-N-acetyltransferase